LVKKKAAIYVRELRGNILLPGERVAGRIGRVHIEDQFDRKDNIVARAETNMIR
jgi:hypothetical protein